MTEVRSRLVQDVPNSRAGRALCRRCFAIVLSLGLCTVTCDRVLTPSPSGDVQQVLPELLHVRDVLVEVVVDRRGVEGLVHGGASEVAGRVSLRAADLEREIILILGNKYFRSLETEIK